MVKYGSKRKREGGREMGKLVRTFQLDFWNQGR